MFESTLHILVNVTISQEPLVGGKQTTSILNYGFVVFSWQTVTHTDH
jgi:hypothetical protein